MPLPKDPNMLLSYINTQLRDNYTDLDELCSSMGVSAGDITDSLAGIGYVYDSGLNRFVISN